MPASTCNRSANAWRLTSASGAKRSKPGWASGRRRPSRYAAAVERIGQVLGALRRYGHHNTILDGYPQRDGWVSAAART
jgi:hypothetical protein